MLHKETIVYDWKDGGKILALCLSPSLLRSPPSPFLRPSLLPVSSL